MLAAGSIFMAVTGFEPTKNPSTVWANSWFDLGFAFVVLGLVITAAGVVLHFRREVPPASAPPAVSPADPPPPAIPRVVNQAVWEAVCDESGKFPDTKALTFRLKQVPAPGSAIRDFTALRCTVTDPAGSTVESTGTDSWRQYTPYTFPGAPQVRPGLYRSRWQGRLQAGEWTEIADGEHEVKAPPPLIVTIIDSKFENWKQIALIAALRVKITNIIGETLRLSGFGFTHDPEGLPVLAASFIGGERLELDREKTAVCAVTPSRSSAYRKISAAGLAAPTSHDSTRASASTSTPSDTSNGRVFSVQLLTTAILMPRDLSARRNGRTSSYRRPFASSNSASRRTISPTRPGCACWPDARRIWPNASVFDIRPSVSKGPSRRYSSSQVTDGMSASAGTSRLSTEKSQVTIVS